MVVALMNCKRPRLAASTLAAAAALAFTVAAPLTQAQGWKPEKHVELIVGGGAQDRLGRLIQKIWQDTNAIGVPVTVMNKLGGGGAIGWTYLNQNAGNGRYVALSASPLLTNFITGKNALSHTDVTPLAQLFTEYPGIMVLADSPFKTGRELMDRLRKDPASVSIAVAPGLGGANHIALTSAGKAAGVDIRKLRTVVFPGSPDAFAALLGGHVQAAVVSASNAVPHVQAGKMRVLAVSAPKRLSGALASTPVWKEMGIDSVVGNWRGMVGPKGLNAAHVAFWDGVFAKLVQAEDWKTAVKRFNWNEEYMNSAESRQFLEARFNEYKALLAEIDLAK